LGIRRVEVKAKVEVEVKAKVEIKVKVIESLDHWVASVAR
jgi:hypothetical protein